MPKVGDVVLVEHNHCCGDCKGIARVLEVHMASNEFYVRGIEWNWEHIICTHDGDRYTILQSSHNPFTNTVGGI